LKICQLESAFFRDIFLLRIVKVHYAFSN